MEDKFKKIESLVNKKAEIDDQLLVLIDESLAEIFNSDCTGIIHDGEVCYVYINLSREEVADIVPYRVKYNLKTKYAAVEDLMVDNVRDLESFSVNEMVQILDMIKERLIEFGCYSPKSKK